MVIRTACSKPLVIGFCNGLDQLQLDLHDYSIGLIPKSDLAGINYLPQMEIIIFRINGAYKVAN